MATREDAVVRLTSFSHGAGCACKLGPADLATVMGALGPMLTTDPALLVGTATGDDAAVYRIDERTALVFTTDFFTPIVDDPYDWGRVAAANALSDVYAMGGRPIFAVNLAASPGEGLAVTGLADPARLMTIDRATPGDQLILTKAIGTGVVATALKGGQAPQDVI